MVRLLSAETECPPKVPICPHSAPKPKPKPKFGRPLLAGYRKKEACYIYHKTCKTSHARVACPNFLLLARYVSNVAKRSIRDQCKKKYILRTDRRPATNDQRPHIWKISNGHISARGRPIHFMFGCRMCFSGSADRMALIPF